MQNLGGKLNRVYYGQLENSQCKKARDGIGFKVKIEMDVNVPPLGIPWTVILCLIAATVSSLL